MSGAASAATGRMATAMGRRRPSSTTSARAISTAAVFKFRLTKEPVPTDGDLLADDHAAGSAARRCRPGMTCRSTIASPSSSTSNMCWRWTAPIPPSPMHSSPRSRPGLHCISASRRAPTQQLLDRGKEVWEQAKCWECHGKTGKGDGEKAAGLKDDLGFTIVPADLTSGQFKSGPAVEDIFRTMTTGLSGTPMPSYRDSFPEEDRWALAYYVLALSAFKDPLTGQPLKIADTDRAALDDLNLKADTPENAYVPSAGLAAKGVRQLGAAATSRRQGRMSHGGFRGHRTLRERAC